MHDGEPQFEGDGLDRELRELVEGQKEEEPKETSRVSQELANLRARAFGGDDESNMPATKFDALFLLQAEIADTESDMERKQLEELLKPTTDLVSGHEKKVTEAQKEAIRNHFDAIRAKWTYKANSGDIDEIAAQNDILYLDIVADLNRVIEGATRKYDTMPPLREYEYAPVKAREAAVDLVDHADFDHLEQFIHAAGEDLDAQRGSYAGDSHGVRTTEAVKKFYMENMDVYEEKSPVVITFSDDDEPVVTVATPDAENPDGISYTFDPERDMDIIQTLDNYNKRQEQIEASKKAVQKLKEREKAGDDTAKMDILDPQEGMYIKQLLVQHGQYLNSMPGQEKLQEALFALCGKIDTHTEGFDAYDEE